MTTKQFEIRGADGGRYNAVEIEINPGESFEQARVRALRETVRKKQGWETNGRDVIGGDALTIVEV